MRVVHPGPTWGPGNFPHLNYYITYLLEKIKLNWHPEQGAFVFGLKVKKP